MLGVHPTFLRRLDEQGVVTPARSQGNQRRYSRAEIDQVDDARRLAEQGITIAGIRTAAELRAENARLRRRVAQLESEGLPAGRTPDQGDGPPDFRPSRSDEVTNTFRVDADAPARDVSQDMNEQGQNRGLE